MACGWRNVQNDDTLLARIEALPDDVAEAITRRIRRATQHKRIGTTAYHNAILATARAALREYTRAQAGKLRPLPHKFGENAKWEPTKHIVPPLGALLDYCGDAGVTARIYEAMQARHNAPQTQAA